jgi:hypothetical protein
MSNNNNLKVNPLLTNGSLANLINSLVLHKNQKATLLHKLPQLDESERQKLFATLQEVFLLDMEARGAVERLEKYCASA